MSILCRCAALGSCCLLHILSSIHLFVCVCVCIFEFLIRSDTHTLAHTHTHAHLRTNWLFCRNLQGACKYATFNAAAINSLQPPCCCIPKQWPTNTHSITYTHTRRLACLHACILYTRSHTHRQTCAWPGNYKLVHTYLTLLLYVLRILRIRLVRNSNLNYNNFN